MRQLPGKLRSRILNSVNSTRFTDPVSAARRLGAAVVPGAFSPETIASARRLVLENRHLLRNTRPTPSAGHLAGFHRYAPLEPLHLMLTGNPVTMRYLTGLCGDGLRTIGLSDITVNRSQQWHKDLLRGQFSHFLGTDEPCRRFHGSVFKVIMYLQDNASLRYVPGSQLVDVPLGGDSEAIPDADQQIETLEVRAGDAVIIDICTTHRGSEESAFSSPLVEQQPKILISTVFGAAHSALTDRMERGNMERLAAWMERHAGR